ncbi:MAG: hypothetical protein R3253_03625 [Longimicrobiales bacterium]|nr:hypothetical protein [Longimicrobiales bacterium]
MPLDAWLLLLASVGLGLGLELAYMRARRRDGRREGGPSGRGSDTPEAGA